MGEEQPPFRFLTDEQFLAMSQRQRAEYLVRAAQEIEEKQRILREQSGKIINPQNKP